MARTGARMALEQEGPVAVQSDAPAVTRAWLADTLHARLGFTKKDCASLVDDVLGLLEEGLLDDGRVKLTGFGTFQVREKARRRGRNPHTDEALMISARRVVTFRPSQALRAVLNAPLDVHR